MKKKTTREKKGKMEKRKKKDAESCSCRKMERGKERMRKAREKTRRDFVVCGGMRFEETNTANTHMHTHVHTNETISLCLWPSSSHTHTGIPSYPLLLFLTHINSEAAKNEETLQKYVCCTFLISMCIARSNLCAYPNYLGSCTHTQTCEYTLLCSCTCGAHAQMDNIPAGGTVAG